jgi:pimeloyl-ACP methyl ester carboxylesterase
MVLTSYGRTFVRVSGPAEAQPLVLLHGIGGSSLQWEPNIEALSASFRTFAVDTIYDNNRSVYTFIFKTPDDFVGWLDELFDTLRIGTRIKLVGLSYGGWLTSRYALSRPERLDRIVLIAPVATVMPLRFDWIWRAALCAIPHRYFVGRFMDWMLEDLARGGAEGRALLEEETESGFLALQSFKPRPLVNPTVLTDEEWRSLGVPVLFLVGENEKLYPAREAVMRLAEVAPRIRTEILPDCGHALTLLQAEMVNRRILDFLRTP